MSAAIVPTPAPDLHAGNDIPGLLHEHYAHVKVTQVFPDEAPADPLVYHDDEGRRLD